MHDHRGGPVRIRLMGAPADVAAMAERIEADPEVTVTGRSGPIPNRKERGQVRVYLDALDS